MRNFFEDRINKARKSILISQDSVLFAENLAESIFKSNKIEVPYLDKKNTSGKIGEEVVNFGNAPVNIKYIPSEPMEYVLFKTPIVVDIGLFEHIVHGIIQSNSPEFIEGRYLYYKKFSSKRISGNDSVIEDLNKQAKAAIERIQDVLDNFKSEVESFNENDLKPIINETINREREKRNTISDSEKKLNPFG